LTAAGDAVAVEVIKVAVKMTDNVNSLRMSQPVFRTCLRADLLLAIRRILPRRIS
jgi:hypothetical protein